VEPVCLEERVDIGSSAAIGSDGTIYVGVDDPVLEISPEGTVKRVGQLGPLAPILHPLFFAIHASDGTIYIGTESEGVLLAID